MGRAAGPRQPGRATCCATTASSAATASRSSCRRRPRRRRSSSGRGSSARSCCRCRCSTATTASATASSDSRRGCSSPTPPTRRASPTLERRARARRRRCSTARRADHVERRHRGRRPGAALLHVGHDRAGQGHRPRPPLPAGPQGVRALPRGAGRRALPRHGRVGVGRGHRAAARPVAAGRGAVRLPARGGLRPARAAGLPQPPRGHERLHDADGDALDDGDRRRGHAAPERVPARVQRRRAAEPRGDPLVPRAVRGDGARLLRADRELSAGRQLPVDGRARGLDGPARCRAGTCAILDEDEQAVAARRARRDLPARALQPALAAGLLGAARGGRGDLRRRVVPHQGRGACRTRTATSGTPAAPTT